MPLLKGRKLNEPHGAHSDNYGMQIEYRYSSAITHSVHPPPFLLGGGVDTPTKFSKRGEGDLTGLQILQILYTSNIVHYILVKPVKPIGPLRYKRVL